MPTARLLRLRIPQLRIPQRHPALLASPRPHDVPGTRNPRPRPRRGRTRTAAPAAPFTQAARDRSATYITTDQGDEQALGPKTRPPSHPPAPQRRIDEHRVVRPPGRPPPRRPARPDPSRGPASISASPGSPSCQPEGVGAVRATRRGRLVEVHGGHLDASGSPGRARVPGDSA
jgi:hypothetical protein